MRIEAKDLRNLIREAIGKKSGRRLYLRFGDPRRVEGGRSVIHDPDAIAQAEEPALWMPDPDGPPLQKYEKGVSAYSVVESGPQGVTFLAPSHSFSGQVNGFLFDRIINDEAWLFRARQIPGMWGTDDEPLIDGETIESPRRISTGSLFRVATPGGPRSKLLDLVDPWDLRMHFDMGYDEFFKKRPEEISRGQIEELFGGLIDRFGLPKQQRALEEVRDMWLEQWEEDHPAAA